MNYEITQIKAIKEVAKGINKNTKVVRPQLNTLQFKGDKVYATDSWKAFRMTTQNPLDDKWDSEHFINTDIIIKPPLEWLHTSKSRTYPDIESLFNPETTNKQAYNVDHLLDILKAFKASGAKWIIIETPESTREATKFTPYNKGELKDLKDIEAILMPLKI